MKISFEINEGKCYVDKRKLVLDCDINGSHYTFTYDDWGETGEVKEFLVDGVVNRGEVIQSYKHCIQAWFDVRDGDEKLFIDRRYCHNDTYDVYLAGKAYTIKTQK